MTCATECLRQAKPSRGEPPRDCIDGWMPCQGVGRVQRIVTSAVNRSGEELSIACAPNANDRNREPAASVPSPESAIRSASHDWGKAMAARNVDKTVSFYAGDVIEAHDLAIQHD